MPFDLSIRDLAHALLWGQVTTIHTLASYLKVDVGDRKLLAQFKKDCIRILPDIEMRLQANQDRFAIHNRQFPKLNPYKSDTLAYHIWEITKSGSWLGMGTITLHRQISMDARNTADIQEAIELVANPWHMMNQGRSILFVTYDSHASPLYQMGLSVPEPIMEVCEHIWGVLPRSHPEPDQNPQDNNTDQRQPPPQVRQY